MSWLSGAPVFLRNVFLAVCWVAGLTLFMPEAQAPLITYVPQYGTPAAIPNFVDPAAGCSWVGVGGQVFKGGQPDTGLVVRVSGTLGGKPVNVSAVTGSSLQFGPGGYDLVLGSQPVESPGANNLLRLQLFDLGGRPKSPEVIVRLYSSCDKNLTVINLVQTTFTEFMYLPGVFK